MSRSTVHRRLSGNYQIDPWGLDHDLIEAVAPVSRLRWDVDVSGLDLPGGPIAVVFNRRFGMTEPIVVAEAVRWVADRHLRLVGLPDVPALGPTLRRFGMVIDHPEEVASLLRDGEVVAIPLGLMRRHRGVAGSLEPEAMAPMVTAGVPIVPVAAVGREFGRRWRVAIGPVIDPPERDDPLTLVRTAEQARDAVQRLLDSIAG